MSDMKKGICDRCNGPIKKPKGYLVWNPITDITIKQPFGTMLICYTCARKIFSSKAVNLGYNPFIPIIKDGDFVHLSSENIWTLGKDEFNKYLNFKMLGFSTIYESGIFHKSVDLFDPEVFSSYLSDQDEIHIFGIVQRLRNRGLDKKKAMKWARELGKLWWSDPEKAEKAVSKKKWFSSWR